mgnify:CR=1 FL=1
MRVATAVIAALVASTVALAQPGPMMGGDKPMGGNMPMMGMMMGHCAMMQRTEGTLAFLKTELKVTDAQEKAWDGFATAYRSNVAGGLRGHGPMRGKPHGAKGPGAKGNMGPGMMRGGASGPFPEAMAQHVKMMEDRLSNATKLRDATKPLYDALSTDQRKTADELLPHFVMMRCPMMGGGA